MKSNNEIAAFYDGFGKQMLRDYVYDNLRVSAAVDRICSVIDEHKFNILDIGCGIGASSYAYKQRRPWITVHGVDISPENISIAKALFATTGVTFSVSEMESPPSNTTYEVVAMIDVYEHIPREKWRSCNATLAKCLTANGALVLTTPSQFHQAYLAEYNPAGLQIVDECVQLEDILKLREDVGGTLTCLEFVSVWKTNDYLHVVIERNPVYGPKSVPHHRRSLREKIQGRLAAKHYEWKCRARRKHVKRALCIDVT